jgi:hypothetical protein
MQMKLKDFGIKRFTFGALNGAPVMNSKKILKFFFFFVLSLATFQVRASESDSITSKLININWQLVRMADIADGKSVDVTKANVFLKFTADGRTITSSNGKISEDIWELDKNGVSIHTNQTKDKVKGLLELRVVQLDNEIFRVYAVYEGGHTMELTYRNADLNETKQ